MMRRMIWSTNGRATSVGLPVARPAAEVELCQERIFAFLRSNDSAEMTSGLAEDGDAGQ